MNPHNELTLHRRTHLAYEMGRLKLALRQTWSIPPIVTASYIVCHHETVAIVLGLVLYLVANGMASYGRIYGDAVATGLKAGFIAFSVPILVTLWLRLNYGAVLFMDILFINGIVGLIAGLTIGYRSSFVASQQNAFMVSAVILATLTGSLGCLLFGYSGVLGLIGGALLATTSFFIYRQVVA